MSWTDIQSWCVSAARLGRGLRASGKLQRLPERPLVLYEFEACPYCRKVREVLSELDLDYVCYPCARGSRHRAAVVDMGGKALFPFFVDPNADRAMYESEDIITHLLDTYGSGRGTAGKVLAPLNTFGSFLGSAIRYRGRRVREGLADRPSPEQLLELYHFEASPYCRKVREVLNELDLAHQVYNVAKKGARRSALVERGGKMQVPYLGDPNTGTEMYESDDIIAYLEATYGESP